MSVLAVRNISKSFGAVTAVRDVSFDLDAGQVLGLIGSNGAGKSTLVGVISGAIRASSGTIMLRGRDVTRVPQYRRLRLGLARTFQGLELFVDMSLKASVQLALEGKHGWRAARGLAKVSLEKHGFSDRGSKACSTLDFGEQKTFALLLAMLTEPDVLLVDEPFAGLDHRLVATASEMLTDAASRGVSIVLIDHNVDALKAASDRLALLDSGRLRRIGTPEQILGDASLARLYFGEDL